MPKELKELLFWVREKVSGAAEAVQKKPSMTKAAAQQIIDLRQREIEKRRDSYLLDAAKKAADPFVKSDDGYSKELVRLAQKQLNDAQKDKKPEEKVGSFTLDSEQQDMLTQALANHEDTIKAIKEYQTEAKKLILPMGTEAFTRLKDAFKQKIEQQQINELAALESLFKDENVFAKKFTGKKPDLATVKHHMTEALKNAHKDALEQFDKDTSANQRHAHELTQRAEAWALFCSTLQRNLRNQALLSQISGKDDNQSALTVTSADVNTPEPENKLYADANLDELKGKTFYTLSNKEVTISPDGKSFTIASSAIGFGLTEDDALQIALLGASQGWTSISMKVKHSDPDKLIELEKNAARACLKAGFDPDKITIESVDKEGKTVSKKVSEILNPSHVESLLSKEPGASTTQYKKKNAENQQQAPQGTQPTQITNTPAAGGGAAAPTPPQNNP